MNTDVSDDEITMKSNSRGSAILSAFFRHAVRSHVFNILNDSLLFIAAVAHQIHRSTQINCTLNDSVIYFV